MTLATYYWFSQTPLYTETMIGDLPWHQMLRWVMLGLGMLMISNVQYAKVPTSGSARCSGILGLLLVIGTLVGVIFLPKQFFFPALMHTCCTASDARCCSDCSIGCPPGDERRRR